MDSYSEIATDDFTPDSLVLKTASDTPLELNNTGDFNITANSSEIATVDFTPDSLVLKTAFDAPLELNNTGDRVKLIVDLGGVIANNVADLVKCRPDAAMFDVTTPGKTPYGVYIDASFWLCLAPNNNLVAGDVLTVSAKAVADDSLTASLDFTVI